MGGDGVAGKPVAVDQQNPPTGPREHGRHGGAGAAGADDDRVVLLRPAMMSFAAALMAGPRSLAAREPAWPARVEGPWKLAWTLAIIGATACRRHRSAAPMAA